MALRNINSYKKNYILRKKSKYIDEIDKSTLELIEDMAKTMYKENGVGLAALPQVGILKGVIVVDIGKGLIKLINPEIIEQEGEEQDVEACLSILGIIGQVKRPYRVKIKGFNENYENIKIKAIGLLVRAFCHEIDHLNGILFIDRVVPGIIRDIAI